MIYYPMAKKLHKLTKLQAQKQSKRNAHQESERLTAMGQESEVKAARWVKEDFREGELKERKITDETLTRLKKGQNSRVAYGRLLALSFFRFLEGEAIPGKYKIWTKVTNEGVAMGIKGTRFTTAFKPSGIAKYDMNAVKVRAVQVGNTVAKLEGYQPKSEGGIFLADALDEKYYANPQSK